MKLLLSNKYIIWLMFSVILIVEFFFGFYISLLSLIFLKISLLILSLIFLLIQCISIFRIFTNTLPLRKKIGASIMFSLNSLFSFVIGFTIPLMESYSRNNLAFLMLPLLIILILVITDKYDRDKEIIKNPELDLKTDQEFDQPVIEFEGKKYIFSIRSLIGLAIGAPILALIIYFIFDWEPFYFVHEIVVKQTVYFLNLFFNMGANANYSPMVSYHWSFIIPGKSNIFFETFCTGIQAICVFAGIIVFIPHSQDKKTNRDIIWRKTKSLVISSFIFYVVNIIRMLIQIELYYLGYPWDSIHVSISAASSFIAAIIILLMHKWIPEFIISIIYVGTLIKKKFGIKSKSKEKS